MKKDALADKIQVFSHFSESDDMLSLILVYLNPIRAVFFEILSNLKTGFKGIALVFW